MPIEHAPVKPADAEDLLPPGQGQRAESPDSIAKQQPGQATGQPGLHGAGTLPGKAFEPPSEQPGQPRPPSGGQDSKEPGGGHTVRKSETLDDEQLRGG